MSASQARLRLDSSSYDESGREIEPVFIRWEMPSSHTHTQALFISQRPHIDNTTYLSYTLDGKGFYVRTNAAAPGVTPHMHWHVLGPGAGANWPGS